MIRDVDIARIAGELPQWQTVASNLGMGQLDIEDIENNNRGAPADQRKSFLRKWIRRDGNAATYEKLSEVLEKLCEQGAAEKIRGIAPKRPWRETSVIINLTTPCYKTVNLGNMLSRLWSWWSGQSQSAPVDMNAICQINPNAKGIAVVIANRNTQGRTEKPLQGVIVDRDNMERALKILQFAVVTKTDIGRDEMLSLLTAVATYRNYPHTYQRMVMVFSGHGIKDALCTHDGSVTIDEIKDRFKPADCPKLFFIDACRGRFAMKKDGTTSPLIDYLMAFSTMPDHVSYEDSTYGGYWMSLLSRKLFEDKSIFDVLTIVNADLKKKYPKTQQPALDSALNVGVNLFQEAGCPQSPFLRDDERDSPSTPNDHWLIEADGHCGQMSVEYDRFISVFTLILHLYTAGFLQLKPLDQHLCGPVVHTFLCCFGNTKYQD
eukprot:Em0003g156a